MATFVGFNLLIKMDDCTILYTDFQNYLLLKYQYIVNAATYYNITAHKIFYAYIIVIFVFVELYIDICLCIIFNLPIVNQNLSVK